MVLKKNIYQYYSQEDKQHLNELGQRLQQEGLLALATHQDLIGWFERYNYDGEPLEVIIVTIKAERM